MSKLLPCPFCGGEATVKLRNARCGYGEYECILDFYGVTCNKCGGASKEVQQRPLIEFTPHTVSDFRNNPILRAKVEDEYEEYIQQIKSLAAIAWNNRADNIQSVTADAMYDEVSGFRIGPS